jgi:hypothetical protein
MNPFALAQLYAAIWMGAVMAPITTQSPTLRRTMYGR